MCFLIKHWPFKYTNNSIVQHSKYRNKIITHSATIPTTKSDVMCWHSQVHHRAPIRHTFHSVVVNVDAILFLQTPFNKHFSCCYIIMMHLWYWCESEIWSLASSDFSHPVPCSGHHVRSYQVRPYHVRPQRALGNARGWSDLGNRAEFLSTPAFFCSFTCWPWKEVIWSLMRSKNAHWEVGHWFLSWSS